MKLHIVKTLKTAGYFACLLLGIAIGLIVMPAYKVVTSIVGGRSIQTLSYDGKHQATLYKSHDLADINFIVSVDGKRVYVSGDLAPYSDGLYRETLVWDKTGRVVVLELMGKKVFAYDAQEQRLLQKGEISQYELYPMPSDYNYAPIRDIEEIESLVENK